MTEVGDPVIRLVIVDDQQLLVSSFTMLLSHQPDMAVVATATNGRDALGVLTKTRDVSLVLMDLQMPVMGGVTAIRHMRRDPLLTDVPVLVLTTFDDEDLVMGALRAGANGYLLKDADPDVLVRAVRTVGSGGSWLDPAISGAVLAALEPAGAGGAAESASDGGPCHQGGEQLRAKALTASLTPREEQVLELVCRGMSNAAIGEQLYVAESTVKTHVRELLGKASCSNRVELIVHAYRHHLALPD